MKQSVLSTVVGILLSAYAFAQEVKPAEVHLLTGEVYMGKIIEIGLDSIRFSKELGKDKLEEIQIPNYRVSYLQHPSGQREFMPHDVIRLKNKLILAKVVEVTETDIKFLNAEANSNDLQTIEQGKVVSLEFGQGSSFSKFDSIHLLNGNLIPGTITEVGIDSIFYQPVNPELPLAALKKEEIEKIIYKSGYEEAFGVDQSSDQKKEKNEKKKWWKFW